MFVVCVREWFDRVNGNTYQSVRVVDAVTGSEMVDPFRYGRGELMALQYSVLPWLVARGILPAEASVSDVEYLRRAGAVMVDTVSVARRRDMHQGGRGVGRDTATDYVAGVAS